MIDKPSEFGPRLAGRSHCRRARRAGRDALGLASADRKRGRSPMAAEPPTPTRPGPGRGGTSRACSMSSGTRRSRGMSSSSSSAASRARPCCSPRPAGSGRGRRRGFPIGRVAVYGLLFATLGVSFNLFIHPASRPAGTADILQGLALCGVAVACWRRVAGDRVWADSRAGGRADGCSLPGADHASRLSRARNTCWPPPTASSRSSRSARG